MDDSATLAIDFLAVALTVHVAMSSYRQTRTAPQNDNAAPRALSPHSPIRTRGPAPTQGGPPPARFEEAPAACPPPQPVSPGDNQSIRLLVASLSKTSALVQRAGAALPFAL